MESNRVVSRSRCKPTIPDFVALHPKSTRQRRVFPKRTKRAFAVAQDDIFDDFDAALCNSMTVSQVVVNGNAFSRMSSVALPAQAHGKHSRARCALGLTLLAPGASARSQVRGYAASSLKWSSLPSRSIITTETTGCAFRAGERARTRYKRTRLMTVRFRTSSGLPHIPAPTGARGRSYVHVSPGRRSSVTGKLQSVTSTIS